MTETALADIKTTLDKIVDTQAEMRTDQRLTDAKVDNLSTLFAKDVEYVKGRLAKAESDIEHGEKARLQQDKAVAAQFVAQDSSVTQRFEQHQKELDRKVVEQPQMDAINLRLETQEDKLADICGERKTEKAVRNIMFSGLGLAWAFIIALVSAYVAHSGFFGH